MKIIQVFLLTILISSNSFCQDILIKNVNIFNGKDNKIFNANILIQGKLISKIDSLPIKVDAKKTTIIDGKGSYLMPGLIDAHWHMMFAALPEDQLLTSDFGFQNLYAAKCAQQQLMRGFTCVRDMGGNPFSLAQAIDRGIMTGPRIFPSGAAISQTGGHGDFDMPNDVHQYGNVSYLTRVGMMAIADGKDQVLLKTREQLRQGASQIKLCVGGGIISPFDPIDATQYTEEEVHAAVLAADNWGTYVTVHAYNPKSVRMAISAGVKCIEHGQLLDESTVKLMAEKGVWWDLQPFLMSDLDHYTKGSFNWLKELEVIKGTDNAYRLAQKYKVNVGWGTDACFDSVAASKEGEMLCRLLHWYTPYEALKMATSGNAELLNMCGNRNPYPAGKLGEISAGAYADMIILDGNPLENLRLIENPDQHFKIIIKDGIIYKNTLNR